MVGTGSILRPSRVRSGPRPRARDSISAMRLSMRQTLLAAPLGLALLSPAGASAQAFLPFTGFATLSSFAWSQPTLAPGGVKWEGSYARISSGFQVTSSKHYGTSAGPTIGLEGGKMWRDGDFVYTESVVLRGAHSERMVIPSQ